MKPACETMCMQFVYIIVQIRRLVFLDGNEEIILKLMIIK